MSGNSFGNFFKVTTWGESHGKALGAIVDGCPPGIKLSVKDIQLELNKRKPSESKLSTKRKESDKVEILSGIFEGKTTGMPISMIVWNKKMKSKDYSDLKDIFRPGHADYSYYLKYGIRDYRGGGRSSGRETVARVMAGAIAKKILSDYKCSIKGKTVKIGKLEEGDSCGGIVEITVTNPPSGLGQPVFDKLDADISKAIMSIGAVKGIEFGAGFKVAELKGSENNDEFIFDKGKIHTKTNNAGGILGGISTGENIVVRFAVKPPASILQKQKTVTVKGKETTIEIKGRHDACIVPRIIPVAESMIAITLVDHILRK